MTFYRGSLMKILLAASAGTIGMGMAAAEPGVNANNQKSFEVAQLFEPQERRPRREAFRSYFDEYGRRVTVDRRGRIVSVEEPQNDQYGESPDYFPEAPQDPYGTGAIPNDPYGGQPSGPSEQDYGSVSREPLPPASNTPIIMRLILQYYR